MEAVVEMMCNSILGNTCYGNNEPAVNASCSKGCKESGYTDGLCDYAREMCICRKPCAAEQTTDAGTQPALGTKQPMPEI
jgi:hypothetical protein